MNVANTYIEMSVEMGFSERDAIAQICNECGLKFSPGYVSGWKTGTRPIPPRALSVMQEKTAHYASKKVGIKTSEERAIKFARLLAPSIK